MNDLLVDAQSLEIGAQIGSINNSILAYCDDILLLSMSENHMNRLLSCCNNYAHNWKLEFNGNKSVFYSSCSNPKGKFYLGIPKALNPRTVSFIFKQFCQSIIRFGLDNLFIKKSFINLLNVRQNILIKNVLALNYYFSTS